MHTYSSYVAPSGRAIVDFVRNHPFAVVATSSDGAPLATHVPIVFPPGAEPGETLVGTRLWGHLGRANEHWRRFAERPDALLVFASSHAYVSPSTYHFSPAVPTLDYATVHLTGRISVIESEEENLAVVERTVEQLEGLRTKRWNPDPSKAVFRKILHGVVSFTIDIDTESAMFKLSQDMPKDVHERVREDLLGGDHRHPDVAELMAQVGVTRPRKAPASGDSEGD
ncbi:transcriptional regulator [Leucobacter sp. OLJS4]|uniref:FMN-binding negative transcriptional regulator n=1 Tax=unclassified Leucobacter TaxID=2621730 RepID=UPI000C17810E|nr:MULTISPECIES: FMN-binding negative transcriptional regulator [unclassified Leucobacter]PIJ29455.1 transcriptional regulator [Leucobacter sp. OLES1]PII86676.1 transcriptional regulator [Leucobacter sp. OLCALW19]PII88957.1 transcriptional regulator [Leucobacter sp. OLAS13]PII96046.1 transcriptional regulator [Leucobacter sp. OLTLW20]PII99320.1 transcriptional regulator [Leucobacter sp. OLDS2]